MKTLDIDGRRVGHDEKVFVIAEIGVNHDGSLKRALELVHHAHAAGADAVKTQVFRGATLMHGTSRFARYQSTVAASDPAAMLRQYELSDNDLAAVVAETRRLGMVPLATPFSPPDVGRMVALGVRAFKLASPDLVNRLLIEKCLAHDLPLILSTGAAEAEEITRTAAWLRNLTAQVAYLHCVSSYPTPTQEARLNWIRDIETLTGGAVVGYSDHTTELLAGACAVMTGACVIEKHLTYNRTAVGPDHAASADAREFAEYVRTIRLAEAMRGDASARFVIDVERDVRDVSRQSLVAARTVRAGEAFTHDDLTCQRPGTGISAWRVEQVIGRRATRDISAGEMLGGDMIGSVG